MSRSTDGIGSATGLSATARVVEHYAPIASQIARTKHYARSGGRLRCRRPPEGGFGRHDAEEQLILGSLVLWRPARCLLSGAGPCNGMLHGATVRQRDVGFAVCA